MWNIYSNFKTDSCCSLACRQPRPTPSQPEGRSCKGASCSLRADLPKLVTQFWDSKPTSKVCFDRLSTSPHPSRASINPGRGVPRSWSCVHVNCQLVATGGKQKVKGRAGLTVHRKHGRHGEQRRLRGLDPSPSTHSPRRVSGSLKGLFSSSKHSG